MAFRATSFTREGCRIAILQGNSADGYVVRVDGVEGPRYDMIAVETPGFSANGSSFFFLLCAEELRMAVGHQRRRRTKVQGGDSDFICLHLPSVLMEKGTPM